MTEFGALSLIPTLVVVVLAIWSRRTIESLLAGTIVVLAWCLWWYLVMARRASGEKGSSWGYAGALAAYASAAGLALAYGVAGLAAGSGEPITPNLLRAGLVALATFATGYALRQ